MPIETAVERAMRRAGYGPKEPTTAQNIGKAIAALIVLFLFAWIAQWAYEQLRPLFNGPALTFWQVLAAVWVLRLVKNLLTR